MVALDNDLPAYPWPAAGDLVGRGTLQRGSIQDLRPPVAMLGGGLEGHP